MSKETMQWLKKKIKKIGYGLEEQLKLMRKHEEPVANIFYDFETSTNGEKHEEYMVCYVETKDENIQTKIGSSCANEMLDEIAERYGEIDRSKKGEKFDPPKVKMLAHNATYDLSFIFDKVTQIRTVERGTDIVCGSALYMQDEYGCAYKGSEC